MDLHGLPGEAALSNAELAFRAEFVAWLDGHPPPQAPNQLDASYVESFLDWQAALADAGYGAPHWPREFGGSGDPLGHQVVQLEEMAKRGVDNTILLTGLHMVGPLLIRVGTPDQKAQHLSAILHGREFWSQLLSEPGAGSDLASVTTRGVVDGDRLVITGQKVWTTFAQFADWAICLCRTDSSAPKHRGLTLVMVDLRLPGVTIRPLRQMDGDSEFNEVFLDDVSVDIGCVVGQVNEGWQAVRLLLGSERTGLGLTGYTNLIAPAEELRRRLRESPTSQVERQDFARAWSGLAVHRMLAMWTASSRSDDGLGRSSLGKLHLARHMRAFGELGLRHQPGGGLATRRGDSSGRVLTERFLRSPAGGIGGGTTENQKNALAEVVLGLPRTH